MDSHRRVGRADGDRVELAVLAAFALLSCWVLALDLWQAAAHGWSWTGTDGVFLVDQMQYVAWIQDASRHVLVSDLFTLAPTPHDLFEPLIVVSGALRALGLEAWLALLVWQPVAILAVWLGARAYIHRSVAARRMRRAALAAGIFSIGPGALLTGRIVPAGAATRLQLAAITKDLWLGFWSWGYPLGLIALGALLGAMVAYDRDRDRGGNGARPALLGGLAALVHPWQGVILALVVVGSEAIARGRGEPALRVRRVLLVVGATALPLAYYAVLDRSDPTWRLSERAAQGTFPLWMVAVTLAPLGLPALLGYRRWPEGFLASATRLWPPAALLLFGACEAGLGAVPTHAFLGVTLPLAVLAAEGLAGLRWQATLRRGAGAAGAMWLALSAAAIADQLAGARQLVSPGPPHGQASGPGDANFVRGDERRALDFLVRSPQAGGVLARFYLGAVVPGVTGRRTYTGNPYYTPDYLNRAAQADRLFAGSLAPAAARALASASGARFLLADCTSPAALAGELTPISAAVRRFGCATLFVLRAPPAPGPP